MPAAFWTLFHVYSSRSALLRSLREELEANLLANSPAIDDVAPQRTLDFTHLKQKCPLLTAIYYESLRLQSYYVFVREAYDDTNLADQYHFRKGAIIQMPNRRAHTDQNIWGDDAKEFNPYRFLKINSVETVPTSSAAHRPVPRSDVPGPTTIIDGETSNLRQDSIDPQPPYPTVVGQERQQVQAPGGSFLVFGSGKNACPGRHFAGMQIMSLVALVVMRFDLSPSSTATTNRPVQSQKDRSSGGKGAWPIPKITLDKISSAIMYPAGEYWVDVRRRPGYEEGVWKVRLGNATES